MIVTYASTLGRQSIPTAVLSDHGSNAKSVFGLFRRESAAGRRSGWLNSHLQMNVLFGESQVSWYRSIARPPACSYSPGNASYSGLEMIVHMILAKLWMTMKTPVDSNIRKDPEWCRGRSLEEECITLS